MASMRVLGILLLTQVVTTCYWNAETPYRLYSTGTPYVTIRGDIREYDVPENCEAVSLWTLNRHGHRNRDKNTTDRMKNVASLKDEIVASYEAGRSQLCAQDLQNFRKWHWDKTLDESHSLLTNMGYEEIFNIGSRLREKYPHLLKGTNGDYYVRPTKAHRTLTSALVFVHGLTEGTNLSLALQAHRDRDDVLRPYLHCDRYQETSLNRPLLADMTNAYYNTPEFIAVQNAVQQRLGIRTQLTAGQIYDLYELCRFDRTLSPVLQSPWCAAFSDCDLQVLEFKDDIIKYHKDGYGSWVNVRLGEIALKDLYENFEAFVHGRGKKIVSYFTHGTMLRMVFSAMGMFKDDELQATHRDPRRNWRSSFNAASSVNLIAILNSCKDSGSQSYRVQLFVNEKETEVCPLEGCTWKQFQDKFEKFKSANLELCSMDYRAPEPES